MQPMFMIERWMQLAGIHVVWLVARRRLSSAHLGVSDLATPASHASRKPVIRAISLP